MYRLAFISERDFRNHVADTLKSYDDSLKSMELSKVKNEIIKQLGAQELLFEVDKFNKAVYKFHLKVNKAEPIEEITLPDGRVRVLMRKKI